MFLIAREDSDIDCYLVVKDETFQDRKQRDHLFYSAEKGSEPTRASFEGDSFVAFSRIPNLDELVSRISVYPEDSRERLQGLFCSSWLDGVPPISDRYYIIGYL